MYVNLIARMMDAERRLNVVWRLYFLDVGFPVPLSMTHRNGTVCQL